MTRRFQIAVGSWAKMADFPSKEKFLATLKKDKRALARWNGFKIIVKENRYKNPYSGATIIDAVQTIFDICGLYEFRKGSYFPSSLTKKEVWELGRTLKINQ
jgi:hypothetical protein